MSADLSKQVAGRILSLQKGGEDDVVFAERVGLTPQVVSNYRTGANGAGLVAAAKVLVKMPRLSGNWLLTGEPPKEIERGDEGVRIEAVIRVAQGDVPPELVELLATLPEESPEDVRRIASGFLDAFRKREALRPPRRQTGGSSEEGP